MPRTLTTRCLLLCLSLWGIPSAGAAEAVPETAWGLRAYDAAALVEVTGFPECSEDGAPCALRTWTLTAPVLLDRESRMLVAAPAGALAGALRITLRLPGEAEDREAFQIPLPARLGVAALLVDGTLPPRAGDRLPSIPAGGDGPDGDLVPQDATAVWILARTPGVPDAPARPIPGHVVPPPPAPHRAARQSPSPMFTEELYFRLVACDEAGTHGFCTECLLYERYEDLLIHAGLQDERLRRLLPTVRRIDREVFRHRLEPLCGEGR